jgi:hypothetical protein
MLDGPISSKHGHIALLSVLFSACASAASDSGDATPAPPSRPSGPVVDAYVDPFAATDGGAGTPAADCRPSCERLGDCAAAPGDSACEGVDAENRAAFVDACIEACEGTPGFADGVNQRDTCESALEYAKNSFLGLAFDCLGDYAHQAVCEPFGEALADCVLSRCEPAQGMRSGLVFVFTDDCDRTMAVGLYGRADVEQNAEVYRACLSEDAVRVATEIAGRSADGEPGFLEPVCSGQPVVPTETCDAACDALRPCVSPRDPISDAGYCRLVCAVSEANAGLFGCVAGARSCDGVDACLQ